MNGRAIYILIVGALVSCGAFALRVTAQPVTSSKQPTVTHNSGAESGEDDRLKVLAQRFLSKEDDGNRSLTGQDDNHASENSGGGSFSAYTASTKYTPLLRSAHVSDEGQADKPSGSSWWLQTITALGIVIGLAFLVRLIYIRMGGRVASHASPVVEVMSRTTVSPRSHVVLLRVGGRVLVVSDSPAGMRTLANVDDPNEVAEILAAITATRPTSISRGFNQLLERFTRDYEVDETEAGESTTPHDARSGVSTLIARIRSMGREGGTT